ncbi:MAG: flagellar hook assembly protein FlgD [Pirellulaceae bacterium]
MSRISGSEVTVDHTTGQTLSGGLGDVEAEKFLELLLAELQNQDPLNPMDNAQMLQQISQIREITATSQLTETLSAVLLGQNVTTASGLIGRQISGLDDDAKNVEGIVDRVTIEKDDAEDSQPEIRVHVGEATLKLENIRTILSAEEASGV